MEQHPSPGIDPDEKYVALTTFRSSGAMVTTPVWFVDGPHRLRVITDASAGKVARLRADDRVVVAACDLRGRVTGPSLHGTAVVEDDDVVVDDLGRALERKYGLAASGITRLQEALGRDRPRVQLVVTIDA